MAEGMLPPIVVELLAKAGEFKSELREAGHEVKHFETTTQKSMHGTAMVGKAALLGLGGAAIAVGGFSIEMADKFEVSHARLQAAIKTTGMDWGSYSGEIGENNKKMEELGFTNADTEDALAKMTVALGDPRKAMDQMGLAADLARLKGIDLSQAGLLVTKAMEGQTRPLRSLGIDLPIAAGGALKLKMAQDAVTVSQQKLNAFLAIHKDAVNANSKSHAAYVTALGHVHDAQQKLNEVQHASGGILDALHHKLADQASESAETFGGKIRTLKVQVEDLGAKLGMALIPKIEEAISVVMKVVTWFEKHTTAAKILGGVIATVLVVAIGTYIAGLIAAAAASLASAAAFLAPWLPLILVIGAVALAGYELVKHWHQIWGAIKEVVLGAWHFIRDDVIHPIEEAFGWVVHQIESHWKLILGILTGPIGLAVGFITSHFDQIVGFVTGLPSKIASAASGMWDGIKDAFKSAINWIIKGWNSLKFGVPSIDTHIPGIGKVGGGSVGVPQIPLLEHGGDILKTGLGIVGEKGPELLTLQAGAQVRPLSRASAGGGVGAGGGGVQTVIVPVYLDRQEIARVVAPVVRDVMIRDGRNLPNIGLA